MSSLRLGSSLAVKVVAASVLLQFVCALVDVGGARRGKRKTRAVPMRQGTTATHA